MEEKEEWRPIVGYEGLYEVSNMGRVRTLDHYEKCRNFIRHRNARIKKLISRNNYLAAELSKDGINKKYQIHRLVAAAFIPNPDNLPIINHKDQNPKNNCVDNLEWCTQKYNVHYADADEKRRTSMAWYFKSEACREKMRRVGKMNKGRTKNGNSAN